MTTELARSGAAGSITPISRNGFESAKKILDTEARVSEYTRLIPIGVCNAVLAELELGDRKAVEKEAAVLVAKLLGKFPDYKPHNPREHQRALAELFCDYRLDVCVAGNERLYCELGHTQRGVEPQARSRNSRPAGRHRVEAPQRSTIARV